MVFDHGLFRLSLLIVIVAFPQIALQGYQNKLDARAIFCNFPHPLCFHILERIGRVDLSPR